MRFELNKVIKLFPKYIYKGYYDISFAGFEIMGEALEDSFSPSRYFYDRINAKVDANVDFLYHNEVADEWLLFLRASLLQLPCLMAIFYVGA